MTKVSSEKIGQVSRSPGDSQSGWLPFGFPIYFSLYMHPLLTLKEAYLKYIGEKRDRELGSWILVGFWHITSDFLAITSSIQMQCPLPWIRALHVEALRMNLNCSASVRYRWRESDNYYSYSVMATAQLDY